MKNSFGDPLFDEKYFSGTIPEGYPSGYGDRRYRKDQIYSLGEEARHIAALGVGSVLEVGCGDGRLVGRLKKLGLRAKGWDISRHVIEKYGVGDHVSCFGLDDLRRLEGGSVDMLIAGTVLGYVPRQKLDRHLRQINRVTSKYAIIFAGTPEDAPEENPLRKINRPDEWWRKQFERYFWSLDSPELPWLFLKKPEKLWRKP